MDQSNIFGTLIDIDIGTTTGAPNDLPGWLREILDRALSAAGVRSHKKAASHEAIAALQEVDFDKLPSMDCPICFDKYDNKSPSDDADASANKERAQKEQKADRGAYIRSQNDQLIRDLRSHHNVNVQSATEAGEFTDPSIYFPIDPAALNYARFPQKNLHTLIEPTEDDILPGYNDIMKEENKKKSYEELTSITGHGPVKMPNCGHIFGKSCIIEWLKENVSCPLCRKEVEELKEQSPKERRLERVRNSIAAEYSPHHWTMTHLQQHSTDVFNPFRRPFSPSVTPLTDYYIPQVLATPTYSLPGNMCSHVGVREPNLVLAGQFPISDFPFATRTFTARRRLRTPATEPPSGNDNTNNENANNDSSDATFSPDSMSSNESSSSEASDPSYNGFAQRFNTRSGGPERSRRSPRSHPYSRPGS